MIFTQLSNASFRFSLRLLGAELEGGAVNCPPPPATTCSAAEAASARVNTEVLLYWRQQCLDQTMPCQFYFTFYFKNNAHFRWQYLHSYKDSLNQRST